MVIGYEVFLSNTNNLYMVIGYQVFLSNAKSLLNCMASSIPI